MIKTNNYYGIINLNKNPLNDDLKQKLATMLFVHPEISAKEAMLISENYILEFAAHKLISRLETQIEEIVVKSNKKYFSQIMEKIKVWSYYFSYPTYKEIAIASSILQMDENKLLLKFKNRLNKQMKNPYKIIDFLKCHAEMLTMVEIDTLLDIYNCLKSYAKTNFD